jgi:transcriptional regulator with XRE-family HTH domain
MSNFKKTFKALRIREGLTQEELSNKLEISRSAISMYERGEREPDFETLEKIADFFNVDLNYLSGNEKESYYIDLQTKQIAQEIFEDKDMRLLFDLKKTVKAKDLINYAKFLKEQYDKENNL